MRGEVAEAVAHRHWVFAVPKMLRPYFKFDRALLLKTCSQVRTAHEKEMVKKARFGG